MKTQADAMRYLLEAHGWNAEQHELVKTIVGVVDRLEIQCKEANDRIEELKQDRAILFQDAERWRELGMGYCKERDDAREQLSAERALSDRLAKWIRNYRKAFEPVKVDKSCECQDCKFIRLMDAEIEAWKEARP